MHPDTQTYHVALLPEDLGICEHLAREIAASLPEAVNKVWHGHPVWFLDGNPVVGYSKRKHGVSLLFWSGRSFDEAGLKNEGSFEAAGTRYTAADQVKTENCGDGWARPATSSGTTRTSSVARAGWSVSSERPG